MAVTQIAALIQEFEVDGGEQSVVGQSEVGPPKYEARKRLVCEVQLRLAKAFRGLH